MIRVAKSLLHYRPGGIPVKAFDVNEDALQLGDGEGRVGICSHKQSVRYDRQLVGRCDLPFN